MNTKEASQSNPDRMAHVLAYCESIRDATECTPTLALDLGIKAASGQLTLKRAIDAARLGTPHYTL